MLVNLEALNMITVQLVNTSCDCTGMHRAKSGRRVWTAQGKVRAQCMEDI
jgi:hypothetical protein